ncbi:hypothetical protein FEDK69T_25060 [Flavobacterium enshiense DK69]|uniref:hypothetical protein n=1 Tax=Flavobacterium enshiense TaxID=1341165 RepID=UPI0003C6307D|nr:hypothetical protein [Flavobacterium enshiense]ESU21439.1 hypothetical protein FEDK69T_25060 [Flavobacterium enshiense DK69]
MPYITQNNNVSFEIILTPVVKGNLLNETDFDFINGYVFFGLVFSDGEFKPNKKSIDY